MSTWTLSATDDDGCAGQGRGGRELILRIGRVAQARFQINDALRAEVGAIFAGVGVKRDQAGVDRVHKDAALARGAGRHGDGRDRGRAGQAGLIERCTGVEIGKAAATHPDRSLGIDDRLPFFAAGIGIERNDIIVRGTDEDRIANLERGILILRAIAVALRDVAGAIGPGDLEIIHIVAGDLIKGDETAATGRITISGPILLLMRSIDRGESIGLPREGHRGMSHEHSRYAACRT